MRVECALLADAGNVRESLLNVIGGGIGVTTRESFPADLASITLAIRLVFNVAELRGRDAVNIGIELRRRNGQVLQRLGEEPWNPTTALEFADAHQQGEIPFPATVQLGRLVVREAGDYDIALTMDGPDVIKLPLLVVHEQDRRDPKEGDAGAP